MRRYEEFVRRVEETGLYPLSDNPWGIPSLWGETEESQWHTGLEADDPWQWKSRIVAERKLYYGHVPGGRLSFIMPRLLPVFFAAYRMDVDIEERYANGQVDQRTLSVARAFRRMPCMPSYQVRQEIGAGSKEKGKVDGAMLRLEKEMFISIGAMTHKRNKKGEPYGWGVNERWLSEAFFPEELEASRAIPRREAREEIARLVRDLGGNPEAERLFPRDGTMV